MDVICDILKKEILLDEKEVIKKKIKECVNENKTVLAYIANYDVNFFAVYSKMYVNNFVMSLRSTV